MELYEAIEKRRTTRQFLDKEVDFEAIKRILKAGTKAPTWDHNRRWEFIVLRTDEEKEYAFDYAKKLADKFNADRYLNMPRPYPITLGQKMYGYAVPKSKKLLKFTLDDGTGTNRTILSGIHAFYEPEQLIGKTCIAITNLPSRPMMGIDSCGMLLSAIHEEDGEEKLHLLMVDPHIPAGAKLY